MWPELLVCFDRQKRRGRKYGEASIIGPGRRTERYHCAYGLNDAYMAALEKASVGEDIAPFADFVAGLVEKRLAGEPLPAVPKGS